MRQFLKINKAKSVQSQAKPSRRDPTRFFSTQNSPAIAEFSTNETMGHSADRLAATFWVKEGTGRLSRKSHQNAADARDKGYLSDIIPVKVPKSKDFHHRG